MSGWLDGWPDLLNVKSEGPLQDLQSSAVSKKPYLNHANHFGTPTKKCCALIHLKRAPDSEIRVQPLEPTPQASQLEMHSRDITPSSFWTSSNIKKSWRDGRQDELWLGQTKSSGYLWNQWVFRIMVIHPILLHSWTSNVGENYYFLFLLSQYLGITKWGGGDGRDGQELKKVCRDTIAMPTQSLYQSKRYSAHRT